MRKLFIYLTGLVIWLMAFSCIDDTFDNYSGKDLRITGSMAPDSRTTFVEGESVIETHWEIDDMIALFTDEQENLRYCATNDGKYTEFSRYTLSDKLINEEGKLVYACYPYDYYSKQDSIVIFDIRKPFLYSQANIENNNLNFQFKHLCAYLQISIPVKVMKYLISATQAYYGDEYEENAVEISVSSDEIINIYNASYNFRTHEITGSSYLKVLSSTFHDMVLSKDSTYKIMLPILPQPGGTRIQVEMDLIKKGTTSKQKTGYLYSKIAPEEGLLAGHVYEWGVAGEDREKENLALLKSFYEKTGGNQWVEQDNWLSDKPLSFWYGINIEPTDLVPQSYHAFNDIQQFNLEGNNLVGNIPEELAAIMDQIVMTAGPLSGGYEFSLNRNKLYGPIPDVVRNHERWNELGWKCVIQNYYNNNYNELDLSNSNLYVNDAEVEDIFTDEFKVKNLYEIFKENKLTQITGSDGSTNGIDIINNVLEEFTNERVNLHLDYQSKGLKTLFFLGEGTEEEVKKCKENLHRIYGDVDGITWLKGTNNNDNQYRPASYFYDSNGQLVYVAYNNPTCPNSEEKLINEKTDKFLRSVLGEPTEHPEFTAEIYTSTDYSRDGEVVTLQEATVGKGINLVFLGEAFVDKDMEPGGLYEQTMRKAMEGFFSIEPYKSMRNRFNVYAVKAVSPNEVFTKDSKQAINGDNDICFEYAQKIPGADKHPPMVTVLYKHFTFSSGAMVTSHCILLNDGSFVAHVLHGADNIGELVHESGGHGLAGLSDEYVDPIYEDKIFTNYEWLDDEWIKFGRGANLDWRNDASTVKWAHFLKDDRYECENLGIYEGAFYGSKGIYRPSISSIMRTASGTFNAPSREQIYKRIMQLSEGESWKYDYEEFVKYDEINRKNESRSAVKPLTEAERKEYIKNHRPPTFIKGTWRDAMKNGKSRIVVPLR